MNEDIVIGKRILNFKIVKLNSNRLKEKQIQESLITVVKIEMRKQSSKFSRRKS